MPSFDAKLQWEQGSLDAAFAELEAECAAVVRGMTVQVWQDILLRTPQYHGRMVASWSYSLNSPRFYDRSDEAEGPLFREKQGLKHSYVDNVKRQGFTADIRVAERHSVGADKQFKLGDTVYICNGVDHGEGGYSLDVEEGRVALRMENLPGTPVRNALHKVDVKYYADVPKQDAARLKTLSIGAL